MINTVNNKEVLFLKGRVNLLSVILQLGHEAFLKDTEEELYFHILNNSRQVMPYTRSCIVEYRHSKVEMLSVMGQAVVNQNSDYVLQIKEIIRAFAPVNSQMTINDDYLQKNNISEHVVSAYSELTDGKRKLMLLPLQPPDKSKTERNIIWVIEFTVKEDLAANSLTVLGKHYSEALWYMLSSKKWKSSRTFSKFSVLMRPMFIIAALLAAFVWACFSYTLPISAKADFELVPEKYAVSYAPIDGVVSKVFHTNGEKVKKGEVVLAYDTNELNFDLSLEEKKLREIEINRSLAELDPERRAETPILEAQIKQELVKISEIRWKLAQTKVTAEHSGVLVMEEKEILLGKEVRAGEKLFETVFSGKLIAEIHLNEKDAVVFDKDAETGVSLYLHARPEYPLPAAKVISISPKPFISETNDYCYRVKATFDNSNNLGLVGMRGVAILHGKTVTLGYYLFRNMILAWREL